MTITTQYLKERAKNSVLLMEAKRTGRDTGHTIQLQPDNWECVGPGGRIKVSSRLYTVRSPFIPNGEVSADWTVVKQSDGVTVKPVLRVGGEQYLILLHKPHPAVNSWLFEFPSGGKNAKETISETAARELEEETGFRPNDPLFDLSPIMRDMRFAPFRFEQNEWVFEARNLVTGQKKPDYEEKPIEVHILPVDYLKELYVGHALSDVIKDFRTMAVLTDHLLSTYLTPAIRQ